MTGKRWLVTKHANEKILERRIPVGTVRNAVEKGVQIEDKASGAMLHVYKERAGKFYTVVAEEKGTVITIITCYESSWWQVGQYRLVKKNERAKMQ